MSITIPINQDDRNQLVEQKEELNEQTSQVGDSSKSSFVALAKKLLIDVPSKKQTDASHGDIYFYEEELRRLNGQSLSQPLQEQGFIITDSVADSRVFLNDGRIRVEENSVEVANIPIIPLRGFSRSQNCGINFDIWSRDRYGSTTSKKLLVDSFTIDSTHKQLNVNIDGVINEIDLGAIFELPITLPAAAVAASIQASLVNIGTGGFASAICTWNSDFKIFTIVSGTAGSSSSVQVLVASGNDMRVMLGFDAQHSIVGRYQNNLLNVEVDGTAEEIKIADFRLCEHDVSLGDTNDDLGIFWSGDKQLGYLGNTKVGPLLCSGINNGKDVAKSIQAKIREAAKNDGFKDCICSYYSDSQTFIIYSGTFGTSSAVRILAASDPLRDCRTLLGFNPPAEERGNEQYYQQIGSLVSKLNTYPNISASGVADSNRYSHSLLYLPTNGVKIAADWQDFPAMTTLIYDYGARGQPRLYPNGKLPVDGSNDRFNFMEYPNVEKTAYVAHGSYGEGELIEGLLDALNGATSGATYTGKFDTRTKRFIINSDLKDGRIFSLLFGSGKDVLNGIGQYIGFNPTDYTGSSGYVSNAVSFSNADYFNPVFINQFYGFTFFPDDTIDELSALYVEQLLLGKEPALLTKLAGLTNFDNEVLLDGWESISVSELYKVNQQYNALRVGRGAYGAHINETDYNIIRKTTAISNLDPNRGNLNTVLNPHGKILNLTQNLQVYVAGVDFTPAGNENLTLTVSGPNDLRIYNKPALFVKYEFGTKQIGGRWSPPGLFGTSAVFTPEIVTVFTILNSRPGVEGYSYSGPTPSGLFSITQPADTGTELTGSNNGPFDLSSANTLMMKVDGSVDQTATVDATAGYVESRLPLTSGFVVKANTNDWIDFKERDDQQLNIQVTSGAYEGGDLAAEIQTKLNTTGKSTYTVSYSSNIFTIQSDGKIRITAGVNDKINFKEISGGLELTATISAGNYLPSALATEIQNKLIAAGTSGYSVSYSGNKFTITSDQTLTITPGVNDKLDFSDVEGTQKTVTLTPITDTFTNVATQIQSQLNSVGKAIYSVNYVGNKFQISSDGSIDVTAANSKIDFQEVAGIQKTAIITVARYLPAALATEIKNQLDAAGSVAHTVAYSGNKFTIQSNGNITIKSSPANFRINFSEVEGTEFTASLSLGTYTPSNLATEIQNQLNSFDKAGYTASFSANKFTIASDGKIDVKTGINDAIDFQEIQGTELTAYISQDKYTPNDLATAIQNILNSTGNSTYTVTYSTSKFLIQSDGKIRIITGVNNYLDFEETISNPLTIDIPAGDYTPANLASTIQGLMNAYLSSTYTVTYSSNKFHFTSNGSGGYFSLLWATGPGTLASVGQSIGFNVASDDTGSLIYDADYNSGILSLTWSSGSNSVTSIGPSIGYDVVDGTGNLSYLANHNSGIFSLLWSSGSNVGSSVGPTLGYNAVDNTGSLSYLANNNSSIFSLLWSSGSNTGTSIRPLIGFDAVDDTGSMSYTADHNSGILSLLWNSGTNSATSVGTTIGFNVATDDTGSLSYLGDNQVGFFSILWFTGTNAATSIGTTIGYDVSSDDTGNTTYLADYKVGIFELLFSSGIHNTTNIAYTTGYNTVDKTGLLNYTAENVVMFVVLTGINDKFQMIANSYSSAVITITQGRYTSVSSLISEMTTKIGLQIPVGQFNITYPANKFTITSTLKGTLSVIQVYEGTTDFLQTIKLDGDIPVFGGGDVGDITAVTVDEVVNVLNSEIVGISAINSSNRIKIQTISTNGSVSSIEITGGTARTIFGFNLEKVIGIDQNNKLKVDIDGDTTKNPILLETNTSPIAATTVASDIQTKLQLIGIGGYTAATCYFNQITPWFSFTDALRILSGTLSSLSTVDVNARTILIGVFNNKIDFEETIGVQLTATLTNGFYDGTELATEIQTQINAAGTSIYAVSFDNGLKQITITSDGSGGAGILNLLFGTGTNSLVSPALNLGFYKTNHTGALSYISDGLVKLNSCFEELKFDSQTTEQGHNVTDVLATLNSTNFISTLVLDTGGGNRLDLNLDITIPQNDTVIGLTNTISANPFYTSSLAPAWLVGRVAERFRLEDGDTLIVNANGTGNQTFTFDAIHGQSVSGALAQTRISGGANDRIVVSVNGGVPTTIILDTQTTGDKIAERIQLEVRSIVQPTNELQAAYSQFSCYYDGDKYHLVSGTGGTGSSVIVSDAGVNNAAVSLRLGTANGGSESVGSGDFVNSSFVTLLELTTKINGTAVGFAASGPNYLKLLSTVPGVTTRIQVSGTAVEKLGFDSNDDHNPPVDYATFSSTGVIHFTNQSILPPLGYTARVGYQTGLGNIHVIYYTIDDAQIAPRQTIIASRLPTITARLPQIPVRTAAIVSALTPALYTVRRDAVQFRLNKRTGSYIKVGDKFNELENNQNLQDANNTAVSGIDAILS